MKRFSVIELTNKSVSFVTGLGDYLEQSVFGGQPLESGCLLLLDGDRVIGHADFNIDGDQLEVSFVHINESYRGQGLSWLLSQRIARRVFDVQEVKESEMIIRLPHYHVVSVGGDIFHAQILSQLGYLSIQSGRHYCAEYKIGGDGFGTSNYLYTAESTGIDFQTTKNISKIIQNIMKGAAVTLLSSVEVPLQGMSPKDEHAYWFGLPSPDAIAYVCERYFFEECRCIPPSIDGMLSALDASYRRYYTVGLAIDTTYDDMFSIING